MYVNVIDDWLTERHSSMTSYEQLRFWYFKKGSAAIKLSKRRSGVGYSLDKQINTKNSPKATHTWELANLYYEEV